MNYTLEDILSNYDSNSSYDDDFNKKQNNRVYDKLEDQIELSDILKEENHIKNIINILKNIKKQYIYSSFNHGYYHIERVLFYGYYLGLMRNLNERNMKILLDSCLYHDIGRVNDLKDDSHGLVAANKMQEVMKDDPFYKDQDNLNTLKCVIDFHSTLDSHLEFMPDNYDVLDKSSAIELMKLIKDSDGLDRVRLSMGNNFSELNPSYLRTEESKKMIKLSHQLNELYLNFFRKKNSRTELDELYDSFDSELYFHSVGYDFFKMESILQNGLLSKNELSKRDILSTKNFDGCNPDDYISVCAYGDQYYSPKSSYENHVKGNIIFYMTDVEVIEGLDVSELNINDYIRKNLTVPVNMGEYSDERFIKGTVPLEKIKGVLIPNKILNSNIKDLSYISSTLSLDALENQIKYYISSIENKSNAVINKEQFILEIERLRLLESKCKTKEYKVKNYHETLLIYSNSFNKRIGLLLEEMYKNILNKTDVRAFDVISHILEKKNLSISMSDDNYSYVNLGETKKLQ